MHVRGYAESDQDSVASINADTLVRSYADVRLEDGAFEWQEQPLPKPVLKHNNLAHFLTETPKEWDEAFVAVEADTVLGFAASAYSTWNRRLVLLHLYVDATARGQGIGRALVGAVLSTGTIRNAQHAWLETQTNNVPALRAYERMRFRLVGLDQTLYADDPAADTAIYLSQSLSSR